VSACTPRDDREREETGKVKIKSEKGESSGKGKLIESFSEQLSEVKE